MTAIVITRAKVPNHSVWRYFCGIVWRRHKERVEIAQALLEVEEHER